MDPAELRLPTLAVPVRLAVVGGEAAPAELHVADVPRVGRSQLLDDLGALLDDEPAFVPVRIAGHIRLIGKHAIGWIAVKRRDETRPIPVGVEMWPDEPSEVTTLYDRMHHVELALVGGTKIIGQLLDSLPADRPRTIDHLNRAGRFVRLWTQEEQFLVNRSQIVWVSEV
jgi:hypothetical protein